MGRRQVAQLVHRRRVAEEVNRKQRRRALADQRLDRRRGDREGARIDVAEDRPRAGVDDGLGGRVEGQRRHDHLVTGAHPERPQGDRQRLGAVGDANAMAHADVGGELALECLDLGAEHVAARIEHRPLPGGDLVQERLERRSRREERHARRRRPAHRQCSSRSPSGTSRTTFAGTPMTTAPAGTSAATTAPAAT